MVSRVNGLLRSTCLKVAPFRFRQPIQPRRLCHSPIQMDETRPGTRGCRDRVRRRERPQRSAHPTAIRRVAVIEVIAILCPVNPAVFLPSRSLFTQPLCLCLPRLRCSFSFSTDDRCLVVGSLVPADPLHRACYDVDPFCFQSEIIFAFRVFPFARFIWFVFKITLVTKYQLINYYIIK